MFFQAFAVIRNVYISLISLSDDEKLFLTCIKTTSEYIHTHMHAFYFKETYFKELLHKPAMILLQCHFIRFGDVDSDEVRVVFIFIPIH